MIKRATIALVLSAVCLVPSAGSTTTLQVHWNIGGFYQNGPVTVSMFGQVVRDLANDTQYAYASVYIATTNGTDSGVGVLDVVVDPAATIGRLSGTIQGTFGPITVDATYLGLSLTTNPVPAYFALYKTPGQGQANVTYSVYKITGELAAASVSSGVGDVDVSGAPATALAAAYVITP